MLNERDQQVTVRRLPHGDHQSAVLSDLKGLLLRVDLPAVVPAVRFETGDLVEINTPKTLYLGEVRTLEGGSMTVGIEHVLDLDAVALIRQVWHSPSDGR